MLGGRTRSRINALVTFVFMRTVFNVMSSVDGNFVDVLL